MSDPSPSQQAGHRVRDLLTDPLPVAIQMTRCAAVRSVPFAVHPGHRPLELDLYGVGRGCRPIVVFIHGGGWRVGHRSSMGAVMDALDPHPFEVIAAAGFVVASISYRLSGEAVFPAQVDDVMAALDWLRLRAHEFGGDRNRVVLWGESAGGHLAALAALESGRTVAGAVCWYAPSDLLTLTEGAHAEAVGDPLAPDSREAGLLGAPISSAWAAATAASPARRVHAGAPAFHLAHGVEDRYVPALQSQRFAEALRAHGIEVETLFVPDADHFWRGARAPEAVLRAAITFCRRVTA